MLESVLPKIKVRGSDKDGVVRWNMHAVEDQSIPALPQIPEDGSDDSRASRGLSAVR